MRATPVLYATDKQRLARPRAVSRLPVVGDKALINHVARVPKAPAGLPVTPKPLVVSENTFVIRGKGDTYLGIAFGDGRQSFEVNLYDHLPADLVPTLDNYILSMTGIIPDAVGIDIGFAASVTHAQGMPGFNPFTGAGGINLVWHTRGEGNRWKFPELHVYYGQIGIGTKAQSVLDAFTKTPVKPDASGSVQVVMAWAYDYDNEGRRRPASDAWVANGYNWTGKFWSVGISLPLPPPYSLVGSAYQSWPFGQPLRSTKVWWGVSFGIGVSANPFKKLDKTLEISKIATLKDFAFETSLSTTITNYGLVYGNGNDFIPATHIPALQVRADQSIDGWNLPVNQDGYYNDPRSQNDKNERPFQD